MYRIPPKTYESTSILTDVPSGANTLTRHLLTEDAHILSPKYELNKDLTCALSIWIPTLEPCDH